MGVFSDDFAAVDFREELCYHSRPEKAKFRGTCHGKKPIRESYAQRETRSRSPSGSAGTAPRRRAFDLVFRASPAVFPWRVLGCGGLRPPHSSMPSTRHGAKFVKTTKNRTSTFCRSPNQINKYLVFLVLRAFPIISYVSIFQIGCRRRGIFEI